MYETFTMQRGLLMNISRNDVQTKPAFLQQHAMKQPNMMTKLAELMTKKLDDVTISDEAKTMLQQLREDQAVEAKTNDEQKAYAFLDLAKQSLQDLIGDIDMHLHNVELLESDATTVEEKAQALHNLSYVEKVANLRGGVFTEDLMQKVVGHHVTVEHAPDDLLQTNAASLGLDKLTEQSPATMRERLLAAKEQLAEKIKAFDEVSVRVATDSTKEPLHEETAQTIELTDIHALLEELLKRQQQRL